MLGPVLAVLGALTHLILINSTRERGGGGGGYHYCPFTDTVIHQGWVARHFSFRAKLYTSVPSTSLRAVQPEGPASKGSLGLCSMSSTFPPKYIFCLLVYACLFLPNQTLSSTRPDLRFVSCLSFPSSQREAHQMEAGVSGHLLNQTMVCQQVKSSSLRGMKWPPTMTCALELVQDLLPCLPDPTQTPSSVL